MIKLPKTDFAKLRRKSYDWGVCEFECYLCHREIPEGAGVYIGQGKHRHNWCFPMVEIVKEKSL